MNWLSLLCAALAALCWYLSSRHQSLWAGAQRRVRPLRIVAALLCLPALLLAGAEYGAWCGLFVALSGFMLVLVALPYADAWRRSRRLKGGAHVG